VVIISVIVYITFFDIQDIPFVRKKLDKSETQTQKDAGAP
jgi:hypothetical protein